MKGHIRQRGKDSWAIVLDFGRDEHGKRKQKWLSGFSTKKEAQRELTRLLHEINTGVFVEPSKLTVGQFLEKWLADHAKSSVSPKTFERYAEIVRTHLIPALGHHLLPKLQPLHIQSCYSQAIKTGRRDGKGGLSAQTVVHHHRILREALKMAMKWQLIVRNPADAVDPPTPERQDMMVLDEDQVATLLKLASPSSIFLPILIAVTTGMRRGEVLALRWQDVDLKKGTISVCQSLEQTRDGLRYKSPKTAKGRRVITMLPMTVEALKLHKVKQAKERLALGAAYQNNGLVCAKPDGTPMYPDYLTKAFSKLLAKSELPKIRFHDLRHTHASQLLRQGVHPKVVSERLGHATVTITLDTYSHLLPGLQEDAALRLEGALQAAIQNQRHNSV